MRSEGAAKEGRAAGPGADGKYSGELYPRKGPMVFFALDAAQKNGALYVMEEKDLKAPMSIDLKLAPLSDISGSLACPTIGPALGTTSFIIEVRPSGARRRRSCFRISRRTCMRS